MFKCQLPLTRAAARYYGDDFPTDTRLLFHFDAITRHWFICHEIYHRSLYGNSLRRAGVTRQSRRFLLYLQLLPLQYRALKMTPGPHSRAGWPQQQAPCLKIMVTNAWFDR